MASGKMDGRQIQQVSWEDAESAIQSLADDRQHEFTPSTVVQRLRASKRLAEYSSYARQQVHELLREKQSEGILISVGPSRFRLAEKRDASNEQISNDDNASNNNDEEVNARGSNGDVSDASAENEVCEDNPRGSNGDVSDSAENEVCEDNPRGSNGDVSDSAENEVCEDNPRGSNGDVSDSAENEVCEDNPRGSNGDVSDSAENEVCEDDARGSNGDDNHASANNDVYEQIRQQLSRYFPDSDDDFLTFHADLIAELRDRDVGGNRTKVNLFVEGCAAAGKTYYVKKVFAVARQFIPSIQHAQVVIFLPHIWVHRPDAFNEHFAAASLRAVDETQYFLQWQPASLATVMEHSNNDEFPQGSFTTITIVTNYDAATSRLVGLNEGFLRRINFVIRLPAPSPDVLAARFTSTMQSEFGLACNFSTSELSETAAFQLAVEFYGGGLAFKLHLRVAMELRRQRRQQQQQQHSAKELPLRLLCDVLLSMMKEDFAVLQQVDSPNQRVLQMIDAAKRSGILAENRATDSDQRIEPTHRRPPESANEPRSKGQVDLQ